MTWEDFINKIPARKNQRGEKELVFSDGTMITEINFTNRFQSYFDGTIESLINSEKCTSGWQKVFEQMQQ